MRRHVLVPLCQDGCSGAGGQLGVEVSLLALDDEEYWCWAGS